MDRISNVLTTNDLTNDRDRVAVDTAFIQSLPTKDEQPVISRTSRDISRRKLSIIVSVTVMIVVIILVIIIPSLGLRKNA